MENPARRSSLFQSIPAVICTSAKRAVGKWQWEAAGEFRCLFLSRWPLKCWAPDVGAAASKEISQEQNAFYLLVSNWSGLAFNSTCHQFFFEHQIGVHLCHTVCRKPTGYYGFSVPTPSTAVSSALHTHTQQALCSRLIFTTELIRVGHSSQAGTEQRKAEACPRLCGG